ncbi:MAG TPA: hypothetical protein V6D21_17680 [Candidatus Obscuribacterales bacterium]
MDIEQMNLENERQLNITGLSDYGKVIAKLLVWLPALPKHKLDNLLDFVKAEVCSNGEPTEILSAYSEEEERCCENGLLEVSFINHLIQEYAPIQLNKLQEQLIELEGANSGLDTLVEQLKEENQQLTYVADEQSNIIKLLEHNEKRLRNQVRDLSIQALTSLKILKICSDTERSLSHAQRQAFAEVGFSTLKELFPKGITPENFPCHEEKIQTNTDYEPIPFNPATEKGGEF